MRPARLLTWLPELSTCLSLRYLPYHPGKLRVYPSGLTQVPCHTKHFIILPSQEKKKSLFSRFIYSSPIYFLPAKAYAGHCRYGGEQDMVSVLEPTDCACFMLYCSRFNLVIFVLSFSTEMKSLDIYILLGFP